MQLPTIFSLPSTGNEEVDVGRSIGADDSEDLWRGLPPCSSRTFGSVLAAAIWFHASRVNILILTVLNHPPPPLTEDVAV